MSKVFIAGSGSFGLALAQVLIDNGHQVMVANINEQEVVEINTKHQNSRCFEGFILDKRIVATTDFSVVKDYDYLLLAVPSGAIPVVLQEVSPHLTRAIVVINVAKGYDACTKQPLSKLIQESLPPHQLQAVVTLIGPSHAEELIVRQPTLLNALSDHPSANEEVVALFSNEYLSVFPSTEVLVAETLATLKNIFAIASGMLYGLGYRDNTRSALVALALQEMKCFVEALYGESALLFGLCGVGDLVVTCTSVHSRNFQAGVAIAKEGSAQAFLSRNHKTVEGVTACRIIYDLAQEHQVLLPINEAIYQILFHGGTPELLIKTIMEYPR